MNTNEILQLIQTLKDTGYKHIDVSHEGSHILLSNAEYTGIQATPAIQSQPVANAVSANATANTATNATTNAPTNAISAAPENSIENTHKQPLTEPADLGGHLVESPIVGTFYAAANPDEDDFVSIGTVVKKGDVLCIIEAMKLMNEIEADADGKIAEILVNNEDGVEYGQPLFRIV